MNWKEKYRIKQLLCASRRRETRFRSPTHAHASGDSDSLLHHLWFPSAIMTTEFDHIYQGLSPEVGSEFKYRSLPSLYAEHYLILEFRVAASGMGWKGVDSEGRTLLSSSDIKWAQWLRVARNFQLRIGMKDRQKHTFDGFTRDVSRSFIIVVEHILNRRHAGSRQACWSLQTAF